MNLADLKLVEVQRLEVKPGEVLLLKYHGRLSDRAAHFIKATAERVLGHRITILVIDETIEPIVVAARTGGPVRKVVGPPVPGHLAEDLLPGELPPFDELHAPKARGLYDAFGGNPDATTEGDPVPR